MGSGTGGDGIYAEQQGRFNSTWHRIYPREKDLKHDYVPEVYAVKQNMEPEVTIVTLICGRFHTLDPYFWQLSNLDYPKKKIHLVLYCSSLNPYFVKILDAKVKKVAKDYASMRLVHDVSIRPSRLSFNEKSEDVKLHLDNIPRLYKKAFSMVNTRYFFTFEDDQINPSHIIKRFLKVIQLNRVATVCGIAFDRHTKNSSPVAFDFFINQIGDHIVGDFVRDRSFSLGPVGSAGFGATIYDSERIKNIELTQSLDEAPDILGSDVTFGYQANKQGSLVMADWDVRSYHIDSTVAIC